MTARRRRSSRKPARTRSAKSATKSGAAPGQTDRKTHAEDLDALREKISGRFWHQRRQLALDQFLWKQRLAAAELSPPPPAPPEPSRRGMHRRRHAEAWREHLTKHPPEKNLGAPHRTKLLREEQGIVVARRTVTNWLRRARGGGPPPA